MFGASIEDYSIILQIPYSHTDLSSSFHLGVKLHKTFRFPPIWLKTQSTSYELPILRGLICHYFTPLSAIFPFLSTEGKCLSLYYPSLRSLFPFILPIKFTIIFLSCLINSKGDTFSFLSDPYYLNILFLLHFFLRTINIFPMILKYLMFNKKPPYCAIFNNLKSTLIFYQHFIYIVKTKHQTYYIS